MVESKLKGNLHMISLTDLATKKMVVGNINYRYCLWFMVKREIKTELSEAANLAC